ncbi:YqzE family protein [Paenibacillus sediminis]|uniref:YqzE family protein n=1 Tax=Paenibacillus sediminis TaxID=664909 RepID=A0ABS4H6B2_9BACL|nr:YqzE family protein [Paenibacillus sediminis]MBP1938055.1 hypothetical protein [Paenibacillus sediminis]
MASKIKGDELLKYITEQVVTYIDTPKDIRREKRLQTRESWQYRWFGMIPFSIHLWVDRTRLRREQKKHLPHKVKEFV